MAATVEYRDGWLCVREEDIDRMEPQRLAWYWPVCQGPRTDYAHMIGRTAHKHSASLFSVGTTRGYRVDLPLLNGGQTKAIAFEAVPIPAPKTRKGIPTRWERGRWEKRLASGWTPA